MLTAAEESLARRDPALPGLGLLLDEERLAEWLSPALGRVVRVHRRHLRYKPGTSCVMSADADGQVLLLTAHPPANTVKHVKTRERAGRALVSEQPALGVLAATPAADRDLRALALLADAESRRRLVGRLLGAGAWAGPVADPAPLRYKPHRRWVGVLTAGAGDPVLLRVYRREAARAAAAALAALEGGMPRTPRLLGRSRRHGALAVEFLAGSPLDRPAGVRAGPVAGYAEAGGALARLHRRTGIPLPVRPVDADVAAVRDAARQLGALLPELAVPACETADRIAACLVRPGEPGAVGRSVEVPAVPIHGDFSPDQAVRAPDGTVGLIDLDSAALGDPAADLGCAAAALSRDVALGTVSVPEATARLTALLAGYAAAEGPAGVERARVHAAAHVLRRAVEPFRLGLTPDWPDAARELLACAEAALDSGGPLETLCPRVWPTGRSRR